MLYDNESRKTELMRRAANLRAAAGYISKIKNIIQSYDGKVYNKRLNEAIETITDEAYRVQAYKNSYGYLEVDVCPRGGNYNDRFNVLYINVTEADHVPDCLTDGKRIISAGWIDRLNNKYAELLKEATELEESARNLDQILNQVEQLKSALSAITNSLPHLFIDVCGLKRYY